MPAHLKVRVQPGARRSEVVGWQEGVLRVRVQAPPIEGRANEALTELLAKVLGVPKSAVAVRTGHAGREKLLAVEGLTDEELRARLASIV
jgi:uncharacterized protein (TIGR00251 family)